ncbi:MAG: penicillin-binding protein 2 [Candidatus Jacksonbacteria bacterium RIFOXYA2_FULL_44_7]|uniref:Penicillin-binding protein 2 n=1 Tax=Candidatus Jacksonbacteria bacterium RIFCSPLOWO2_02_FULL_44_20 TaxID=1798460 RepID=A0A1G2AD59_9BACT|nr:MAG: Penicillin-binding protein 2 [Parcubacteria group bacterium GW2011_GWC2_44_17]KKT48735.1 MAG: Penicillin-binding protein 2 [Parcubacteria group bacterium GW2011_GWF2_44_17]OGY71774.1 MAG: penicillin-binding protein 2 [Candidatus Jacksonbacteria bacterium RIFCSPHIGHO2_02_FULL_44_25]OGY73957.1 MAG: penicillin-binding protein 2 [Candidatus Jacksonbacteria bacterium RIFCSPLOWO2_02_FULL_44_20]OGY74281.1 MAG: penicillin-binding protein 2 [Candidatus Jacksonbacteria bacterium RIFCSPLOWO2_12_FU
MKIRNFNKRAYEGTEYSPSLSPLDTLHKPYDNMRIRIMHAGIWCALLALLATLSFLEIIHGETYRELAEQNRIRVKEKIPPRGIIYASDGTPLVVNAPEFTLLATPFDIYANNFPIETIIAKLEERFGKTDDLTEGAKRLASYSYVPIVLKKNLSYEEGIKLVPVIAEWPGVFLQESFNREYPYKNLLAHIIGYTSAVKKEDMTRDSFYSFSDARGQNGVEAWYEKELRGVKGTREVQVNAFGKEDRIISETDPKKGEDILLSIDLSLQEMLTARIEEEMQKRGVKRAAGIAMDPRNGEILALISLPAFDNNLFTTSFSQEKFQQIISDENSPLFNRAIAGEYPPGSTFKIIVGSAALEEGVTDERFSVLSTGGIRVGEWFFPDWLPGGHGTTDIRRAIAWSVNTYFYTIGGGVPNREGLGIDRIVSYAKKFNLGVKTGVDLTGEGRGFLPTKEWKFAAKNERWYLGDTYHASIGQGDILATPLQIALYTIFFANGGVLYRPHIVKKERVIIDKNFISTHNVDVIREGLRDTVRYGSARSLEIPGIEPAGKTGTAEFSKDKKPHGWFTGFAPFNNPEIVITVLMEESGGSEAAAPIARDFFNWYFTRSKKLEVRN